MISPWHASLTLMRLLGMLLGVHFLFACTVKISHGTPWQLLWFCHISLAVAAIGFLTESKLLRATALTNVLVLHSLWIIDFIYGTLTGTFPFAFSAYVAEVDIWNWIVSLHHLYLLPLLIWSFWRDTDYPREAWLLSATSFVVVMLACRGLLSPVQNVNYAYYIPDSLQVSGLSTLNQLPSEFYLIGVHVVANVVAFFPAAFVLNAIAQLRRQFSSRLPVPAGPTVT